MLALWSRTAQATSSCRCRVCHYTANTLIRRSTTAASRRKVTASDVFTACYTTILGTAAVIDAKRKDARRKELDQKLEKARADLSNLATQEAHPQVDDNGADGSPEASKYFNEHMNDGKCREKNTAALIEELGQIAATVHHSRASSSWLQSQIDWVGIEAAVAKEEKSLNIYIRHPKCESQLERTVQSTEALIEQLLRIARAHQSPDPLRVQKANDNTAGEELLDEVEELGRSPYYPSYEHPHTNPAKATKARDLLSEAFRRIFNRTVDVKEMVGKICYNLLLSTTPPNIHNYNTLIAGFNRVQRPELAQAVVNSYLTDVRWPATQQTMVALLNHAKATDNIALFRQIVQRMRGAYGDGLHIRVISKDVLKGGWAPLWADRKCAERSYKWVQRTDRGNQVFDALVRGWLHFGRVNVACMSFVACVRRGRVVSAETIHHLLTECHRTLNQQAARALLKGFVKYLENFEMIMEYTIARSSTRMARRIADMFYALFDLCEMPYRPSIGPVRQTLKDIVEVFRNLHAVSQAELEVQQIVASSNEMMKRLHSGESLDDSVAGAISILHSEASRRDADARLEDDYRRLARLAALAKRYESLERKTRRIEVHLKLTALNYKFGCDLDEGLLPPIDWQNRQWGERLPVMYSALEIIQLESISVAEEDIKSQLLDGFRHKDLARRFREFPSWDNLSIKTLLSFFKMRPNKRKTPIEQDLIYRLKEQVLQIEDVTKAILFSHLPTNEQRRIIHTTERWSSVHLQELAGLLRRESQSRLQSRENETELKEQPWNHGTIPIGKYLDNPFLDWEPATVLLSAEEQTLGPADQVSWKAAAMG